MVKVRKVFSGLACAFALIASTLLCTSLGTTFFIDATALDKSLNQTDLKADCDNYNEISILTLCTHFGLFKGVKVYDAAFGDRNLREYRVFTEHEDVYNLSLVIATIVFILGAIVFGLVATVFGLVNTLTVPIETIHGPMGLFVWNGIGGIMSTGAWIVYLILFQTELKENVLNEKDTDLVYNYRTEDVYLGYSFWFLVSANVLLFSNIAMAYLAKKTQDPDFLWRRRRSHDFAENQNKEEVAVAVMY